MSDIREKAKRVAEIIAQLEQLESNTWPEGEPTNNDLWKAGLKAKIQELEAELNGLLYQPGATTFLPIWMPPCTGPLAPPVTSPAPAPFPNYEVTCGAKP